MQGNSPSPDHWFVGDYFYPWSCHLEDLAAHQEKKIKSSFAWVDRNPLPPLQTQCPWHYKDIIHFNYYLKTSLLIVKRRLSHVGLRGRHLTKKPLILAKSRKVRLEWILYMDILKNIIHQYIQLSFNLCPTFGFNLVFHQVYKPKHTLM